MIISKDLKLKTNVFVGTNQLFDIPEEVMPVISKHWAQFPPSHPLIPHVFGILFFFLWIINFVGNGLVIFIFLKTKSLRYSRALNFKPVLNLFWAPTSLKFDALLFSKLKHRAFYSADSKMF